MTENPPPSELSERSGTDRAAQRAFNGICSLPVSRCRRRTRHRRPAWRCTGDARAARRAGCGEWRCARADHAHVVTHGVFEEQDDGRFAHSPLSRLARSDHPRSQHPWIRQVGSNLIWTIFSKLGHAVRNGQPAVSLLDPPGLFPYFAKHPEEASVFNAAMASKSQGDIAAMLKAYDFTPFATIGDIGGARPPAHGDPQCGAEGQGRTVRSAGGRRRSAGSTQRALTVDGWRLLQGPAPGL